MSLRKEEKDYYPDLKSRLEALLKSIFDEFHIEITAPKTFSNKLKAQIPEHRNLIFHFLNLAPPDITGFIKEQEYSTSFFVAEFKRETLRLEDIYQARKYAELFEAKYALLITTEEIPEELKRLSKVVYSLLSLPGYRKLTLVRFDEQQGQFVDWFEKNPFHEGI